MFVGVMVGVLVDVFVGVLVGVFVGVLVGVFVAVGVLVDVFVGVLVDVFVGELVGVFVAVGVLVDVWVGVVVGVAVGVGLAVSVGVIVGIPAKPSMVMSCWPEGIVSLLFGSGSTVFALSKAACRVPVGDAKQENRASMRTMTASLASSPLTHTVNSIVWLVPGSQVPPAPGKNVGPDWRIALSLPLLLWPLSVVWPAAKTPSALRPTATTPE